jgi:uncharacterized protein with NRDE domain
MCLIVVALGVEPRYPLMVAANRDERHTRPAAVAAWWPDRPQILGGRDLEAGGTWLAVDRAGRFAAVTNIRDRERPPGPRSRGSLVVDYLAGADSAGRYAERASREGAEFGAFNLLLYDGRELWFASNRAAAARLGVGLHSFSNAPVGSEWPKTASARQCAEALLSRPDRIDPLFALLAKREDSGSLEQRYERSHFVVGTTYGTRCSTVLLFDAERQAAFAERSFDAAGRPVGEVRQAFELEVMG